MASERLEALMRIVVCIVSGVILKLWMIPVEILTLIHWIVVIITGKRNKRWAEFCHRWNAQIFIFLKYLTFASNKRPFPFTKVGNVDKVDMK